ncbi:MAG: TOMM precursor leader peptide-binding protein [Bacillota bacterium]
MSSALQNRPRLKHGFALIPLDESTAMLKSAERAIRLSGAAATILMPRVIPLLDGEHTVGEIAAAVGVDETTINRVITLLGENQLLEREAPVAAGAAPELAAFLNAVTSAWVQPDQEGAVATKKVLVIAGWGEDETSLGYAFRQNLTRLGVGQVQSVTAELDRPWDDLVAGSDLVMFMPAKPLLPVRAAVHKACLAAKVKLCSAEFLSSTSLALGPTVIPGETACWTCLDRRQKGAQEFYTELLATQRFLEQHPEVDPVGARLPALTQMLAGLAAFEALRVLTNVYPPVTVGSMVIFNAIDYTMEQHPILKLPRCPDCSPVREQPMRRVWSW